ncbi:hypothetical protein HDU79_011912 [Rhizoclosmatium sp. JEL0117]|nr:hypothetical protein HDU79_011912 [Rhizoclosmatium sp. JEL0117]
MTTSILPLEASDLPALQILYRSSAAYSTTSYYAVTTSSRGSTSTHTLPDSFHLKLTMLHNQPTVTGGSWIPEESDLNRYKTYLAHVLSFKAVSTSGDITGIIITDYESWNNSAKVYEFIVDKSVHRSGNGKKLMSAVIENAKTRDITRIVCETQTRNTRAISFYLKMEFTLDAVDVSFYGPDDLDKQDVAV